MQWGCKLTLFALQVIPTHTVSYSETDRQGKRHRNLETPMAEIL